MADDASGVKKDSPVSQAEQDGENAAVNSEGGAAKPAGGRKKLLFLAIGGIVLLLAIGGGAAFFLFSGTGDEAPQEQVEDADMAGGVFLDVLDVTVNLNSQDRQAHFLKMSISIEVGSDLDKGRIEKLVPHVIDQFQVYLRELRIEDLSGSAGIYRLREELLDRVRSVAEGVPVKDVLFREILVQ